LMSISARSNSSDVTLRSPSIPSCASTTSAPPVISLNFWATAIGNGAAPEIHARTERRSNFGVSGDSLSAMYMRGSLVKLALPAADGGARTLTLRLRSFRRTPLTVYVNGKTIADSNLDGKDFQTVSVPLTAGVLAAGENKLELRATSALSTLSDGGFAIDYIALAPTAVGGALPDLAAPPEASRGHAPRMRAQAGCDTSAFATCAMHMNRVITPLPGTGRIVTRYPDLNRTEEEIL